MTDRSEIMEAALDASPEGVALLDHEECVVFWNRTAERITGYPAADLLGRPVPRGLEPLILWRGLEAQQDLHKEPRLERGSLIHAQHRCGHDLPVIARRIVLRNDLGGRLGTAAVFHRGEYSNALPHRSMDSSIDVQQSQVEMQARLEDEFQVFLCEESPFGVLWICVDQAAELRKTHGFRACETMMESVERTLANSLRAGDEIGRWGDDDFLILSHERSAGGFAAHGRILAEQAHAVEFRWWGDRVAITASIGVAAADKSETLPHLLERAQEAMQISTQGGGNNVTVAPGRQACSQS